MERIQDIPWEEVFDGWREREASNLGWIRCATEIKGWPDWESWRRFTAEQIKAEERAWELFRFTDPINEVPALLVGPHSGWQEQLAPKNALSFSEFLEVPEIFEKFSSHPGVLAIMAALPFSTQFIGLARSDGRIVCIEGNHRATAIALARKQGRSIDYSATEMTIALACLSANEDKLMDEVLARGTSKIPPETDAK